MEDNKIIIICSKEQENQIKKSKCIIKDTECKECISNNCPYSVNNIKFKIKDYKLIELAPGTTIDHAVEILQDYYRKDGEFVKASFNDHYLYSDTVTLDSAYKEIVGKTKSEYEKEKEEQIKKIKEERENHKKQIPNLIEKWIEEGHKILDEKYHDKWDMIVPIRLNDLYNGMELKACLDIIGPLNSGCSLEEAEKIILDQNHSGISWILVNNMIREFCDRGEEFSNYVNR